MRGRDVAFLLGGLLAGALLVALVSSAGLIDLSGTAAVTPPVRQAYFSLDVSEMQNLLTASYPADADALLAAVTQVAGLAGADDFATAFAESANEVQLVTERSFQALTGVAPDPALAPPPAVAPVGLIASLADGPVTTCVGIDSNPYSADGPQVYLALDLPETQIGQLPEGWAAYRLDVPKDGELFWQMLSCQEVDGGSTERSR